MLEERILEAGLEGTDRETEDEEDRIRVYDHQEFEGDDLPTSVNCADIIIRDSSKVHVGSKNYFIKQFHVYEKDKVYKLSVPDLIENFDSADKPPKLPEPPQLPQLPEPGITIPLSTKKSKKPYYIGIGIGATLVLIGVIACVIVLTNRQSEEKEELPLNYTLRVVDRGSWFALAPEEPLGPLYVNPPKLVMVSHTASSDCDNERTCKANVRSIQAGHIAKGYDDIGYNFLLGGDGFIYEGRGWGITGAHTISFNGYSIGVAFIGNFMTHPPSDKQLDAFQFLLDSGVKFGKLDPNYKILLQKQVQATESPGSYLIEILQKWPHWSPCDEECENIMKSKKPKIS